MIFFKNNLFLSLLVIHLYYKVLQGVIKLFSKKIKQLRKENNLTQSELADKLNCSLSKIGMWETNKREPTKDDLIMLANAFDISVDYLLGLDDENQTKNKRLQNIDSISAHRIGKIEKLSDEALDQLDDYIKYLELKYKK